MRDVYAVLIMACLCAFMSVIFGIIGTTGDDLALFISYLCSGGMVLLAIAGLVMGIIEGFKL